MDRVGFCCSNELLQWTPRHWYSLHWNSFQCGTHFSVVGARFSNAFTYRAPLSAELEGSADKSLRYLKFGCLRCPLGECPLGECP